MARVFLADFGLARIAQAGESTLSQDALVGTPQYISPEQARGDPDLDARTDVYSLGVVMYELLVGRVPYQADTPYAVIHDHIYAPLPLPRSIKPGFPESLERVLLKALAKERDDRYGSVAELMAAFEQAAQTIISEAPTQVADQPAVVPLPIAPVATPPTAPALAPTVAATAPKHSNTGLWIGLGVVALAVVAIGIFVVFDRNQQLRLHRKRKCLRRTCRAIHPADPFNPFRSSQINRLNDRLLRCRHSSNELNDLIAQNQLDQAQAELTQVAQNSEKLLDRNPDLPPEPRAALHTLAGESWLALDKPDRAQPHFEELKGMAPDNAEPLLGIALAQLLARQPGYGEWDTRSGDPPEPRSQCGASS